MGVVDEYGGAVGPRADQFHAPGRALERRDRGERVLGSSTGGDGEAERAGDVVELERAHQRHVDVVGAAVDVERGELAEAVGARPRNADVVAVHAVGDDALAAPRRDPGERRVLGHVGVEHGEAVGRQQFARTGAPWRRSSFSSVPW